MTKITRSLESDREVSPSPTDCRSAAGVMALMIGLCGVASDVRAQWTVTNLHPPGEWAGSWVSGTSASRQVGSVLPDGGSIGIGGRYASLWDGADQSWMNLHPVDDLWTESEALGVADHQQVGHVIHAGLTAPVTLQRACLWSGTAESMVLLADVRSSALATSGTSQVGWVAMTLRGPGRASLWSGTPESRVDLHPAGASTSSAMGIHGSQQVGSADSHAGLWHGTADSWVDLHPVGATSSFAVGTTGTRQAGDAVIGGERHASLWSGTAASWVDLNPTGATVSSAAGIFGDWQVGYASFGDGPHASLWNGTAGSWEDLSLTLSGSWIETFATGIWSDHATLSITGYGFNVDTERTEALLWTRAIPAPSNLAMLGFGGVAALRRRER